MASSAKTKLLLAIGPLLITALLSGSGPGICSGSPPTVPGHLDDEFTLIPSEIHISMGPGEDFYENKFLHLPQRPVTTFDVLFCFDLTGSMDAELANVKATAAGIMTDLQAASYEPHFGVISHMDYPDTYSWCTYTAQYGSYGDYPYSLDHPISGNAASVQSVINGLAVGSEADSPESYARALIEASTDPAVGLRTGSKKFIVAWGDALPHDCDVYACIGLDGTLSTGADPGRDGVAGTPDDIGIFDAVSILAAANICLVGTHGGDDYDSWNCWSSLTGCQAFRMNPDGTIEAGANIAEYILSTCWPNWEYLQGVTLEVCTPGYENWLAEVEPPEYDIVWLDAEKNLEFTIRIQVPDGAACGEHCFAICALAGGVEIARQYVYITIGGPSSRTHDTWGSIKARWK